MDSGNQINFRIEMDKFPPSATAIERATKWQRDQTANNSRTEAWRAARGMLRSTMRVTQLANNPFSFRTHIWIGHFVKKQRIPDPRVSFEVLYKSDSNLLQKISSFPPPLSLLCEHVSGLSLSPFPFSHFDSDSLSLTKLDS
jgi:hypothetical protein